MRPTPLHLLLHIILMDAGHTEVNDVELEVDAGRWVNFGDNVTFTCPLVDERTPFWMAKKYDGHNFTEKGPAHCPGHSSTCSLSHVGLQDIGSYYCGIFDSQYSKSLLLWVAEPSPPAQISITPPRSQFFKGEGVTLRCGVQGNPKTWRIVRFHTASKVRLTLLPCSGESLTGWDCHDTINAGQSGEVTYWCQSGIGNYSNAIKITIAEGDVILESPVLPVLEGEAVTLNCRYKTTPSNLTPDFYKDGSLIRTESTGEMTIPAVSKSDEGLYKCSHSTLGESPESKLDVIAPPPPLVSLSRLLCSVLVFSPYLITTVVMLLYFRQRRATGQTATTNRDLKMEESDYNEVTDDYNEVTDDYYEVTDDVTTEHRF